MKPLTLRELNRATLARQLLLERIQLDIPTAVHRLGALQGQRPRAPYVALAARLEAFEREDLSRALHDRTVVRATPRALRPPRRSAPAGRHARAAAAARRMGQRAARACRPHAHVRRRDAPARDPEERRRPADDPADLEREAALALAVLEPAASRFEVELAG